MMGTGVIGMTVEKNDGLVLYRNRCFTWHIDENGNAYLQLDDQILMVIKRQFYIYRKKVNEKF